MYYIKRTDLSYTVNYLEKETNNVIHEPKKVDNQTYGSVINSEDEIIDIDTYKYIEADKESLVISNDNNVINLYYEKEKKVPAKVKYYEKGTDIEIKTETVIPDLKPNDTIKATDYNQEIIGYVYDSANPDVLTITENEEENVLKLYYTKEIIKSSYTVNYVDKDTNDPIHTPKTVEKVEVNTTINAQDEIIDIANYKYDSSDKQSITIVEDSSNNVIILYYTKNNNELSYTINYIDKDTNSPIHNPKVVEKEELGKVVNAKDEVIDITNYKYDSSDKENITIVEDNSKNVINIYYVKKTGNVVIKYIDEDTGKVIATGETITGKIDDEYTSKSKEIKGYDLTKNSGNTKGKITEKDTTVIYYYKAKKTVTPKQGVASLPNTGNSNGFAIIITIMIAIGMFFAIRYHKLKDIK